MRILKLNLLVTALLFLGISSAQAWRVDMVSDYSGGLLAPSDTVSVSVFFDSEGATGLMLLGVGVQFDSGVLSYNPAASSFQTYLMYTTAKAAYLQALGACTTDCAIHPASGGTVVALDYASSKVGTVTPVSVATTPSNGAGPNPYPALPLPTPTSEYLGTLVFHVIGVGDGLGEIGLLIDPQVGGIVQLGGGVNPPVALHGGVSVLTPEPTTAVLIGLGLAGLGVAGRRRE